MNRQERIAWAEQLVLSDPNISKRRLQMLLVQEYGVGLSDTTRRGILRQASVPSVLRQRVVALHRVGVLNTREARTLRKVIRTAGNAPYVVEVVNKFYADSLNLYQRGLTWRELKRELKRRARQQGLIAQRTTRTRKKPDGTVKGEIDFWKMFRRQRDDDIAGGDYVPKVGVQGGKRPKSWVGDVKAQKIRYQDKQSTAVHARWVERERSRLQTWISQKQRAIDVAISPARRRELIEQQHNLERSLRAIR